MDYVKKGKEDALGEKGKYDRFGEKGIGEKVDSKQQIAAGQVEERRNFDWVGGRKKL